MTREEAKEILTHNWTRVDNPNYSESELDEAFFMAVEALSAEAEFTDLPDIPRYYYEKVVGNMAHEINMLKEQLESVVRCKDCIHSDTTGVYVEDVVYCKWLHTSCVKNGYCHRGERKGGDAE